MNLTGRALLPDIARRPIMILLLCALPQLVLLALHYQAFTLVQGELDSAGRGAHLTVFSLLGFFAALWTALGLTLMLLKRSVGLLSALLVFAGGFGYLWTFLHLSKDLIPASVGAWMLSDGELAYSHMALVAPALFYGLVLLAGAPLKIHAGKDIAASIVTVVFIPVLWFLVVYSGITWKWDVDFPMWVFVFVMFVMTAVMLLGFLRVMLYLHAVIGKQVWVPFAASLVFPVAGLLLNSAIPFPSDFQDWRVYALTVINAVFVTIPLVGGAWRPVIWFSRVATYPFTIYFFILFLPFLPLSIPAMLAAGGGFLILAPTLLFVIHTRRLLSEGRLLSQQLGRTRVAIMFLVAFSMLPAGYYARALMHKSALTAAIDAVYHPDYSQAGPDLRIGQAQEALDRLRKMKEGIYAPLLSDVYDAVVFDGMVLPDHKMDHMQTVLTGAAVNTNRTLNRFEFFDLFGSTSNRRANWRNVRQRPSSVSIENVETTTEEQGSLIETEVVITMRNHGSRQAEFVAAVNVPEPVGVSGFWLDVEGERVPGLIFDRKTALWVFHMIRDQQRRDPGIIHYVDKDTLELRVFPFRTNETRTCALKFLYPRGSAPSIRIGDRALTLSAPDEPARMMRAATDDAAGLFVPAETELPVITRERYAHFLIDASAGAVDSLPMAGERIAAALEANPAISTFKIDLVNYRTIPVGQGELNRENWREEFDRALNGFGIAGGFWPERAINHAAYMHHRSERVLTQVPAFVVVSDTDRVIDRDALIPEFSSDVTIASPDSLDVDTTTAVRAFRCDDAIAFAPVDVDALPVFRADAPIEVYDGTGNWTPVTPDISLLPESRYAQFASLRSLEHMMASHPNRAEMHRREVLNASRDSGIVSEHTAYIVVENKAQWEILKRKEKEAMNADSALEFDEFEEKHVTPEPSTWLMIAVCLVALMVVRRTAGRAAEH